MTSPATLRPAFKKLETPANAERAPFHDWIENGPVSSMFLDVKGHLYIMTHFGHRRIADAAVSKVLTQRDMMIRNKLLRNRKAIRFWFGSSLVLLVSLVVLWIAM